ncbi:methyltransferase nsun7-like isoform x1 protein [Vespula squamosa]|uniref:Methyltransferase nsun7-like isoform x1 protein n=1 Tax=Vespula squamosa TaxID=30214 RepID=A0ABD1ZZS5_VESSQ
MSATIRSEKSKDESDFKVIDSIKKSTNTRKANMFDVYANIFRLIIVHWIPRFRFLEEEQRNKELNNLILPSNTQWRHRVYYTLVELQREKDIKIIGLEL